jgi:hypothetical protein
MSALALDFTYDEVAAAPHPRRRLYAVRGTVDAMPVSAAAATLDDLLGGAWSALSAGSTAACPVCAATLRPRWSAGAGVSHGRCDGCGSALG